VVFLLLTVRQVIKNKPSYILQAKSELIALQHIAQHKASLASSANPEGSKETETASVSASPSTPPSGMGDEPPQDGTVNLLEHFTFKGHPCFVFELLSLNLFEVVKQGGFRGLPLHLVREIMVQLLDTLAVLNDLNIIHSDLKPENILLTNHTTTARIKLIDFGSACYEGQATHTYLQSRFYRSPEVLLGLAYVRSTFVNGARTPSHARREAW